ncbi:MAG: S1 RNA-binding domain-containing protein, partial [Chloroflexota bacterium]
MTEELQDGTVQPEASAPEPDQNPDRAAVATAVADEPGTDAAPAPSEAVVDATEAPMSEVAADAASSPSVNEVVGDAAAATPDREADDAPAAESTNPAAPADAEATPERNGVGDTAVASIATMPLPAEIDADDTADAPSAAEEDAEPVVAPKRDLGPEPTTMEELLAEQDSDIKSFKHGDVVEGTVVRIDKDEILVDIGAKSEGVVSNRELYGRHAESQPQLAIGDTVLVYVLQPESQEGHAVLSLRRAGLERKWRAMQEQFEAGVIIEAPVIDHNKGGLIVDCGIRGFVPISQIVDFPRRPQNDQPRDAAQEIAEKLQPFVGRKLRLKILEVNRKANRLILSEKVALYEERREKRDELFSSLQVGQKVSGTVRSIAPFGVFIDL